MKKILSIACLLMLVLAACKDKNAKPSDNQDIPGQITQPGSINPQSVPGRLDQATSAVADQKALAWAGDNDPVCGMKIDQSAEDTVHYGGKIYGFCSSNCKGKFQEDPKKWVENK